MDDSHETPRGYNWKFTIVTWLQGLAGIVVLTAVVLGVLALLGQNVANDGSSGSAGLFAISLGFATLVSVLLVGSIRLHPFVEPMLYTAVIALFHVATYAVLFFADFIVRVSGDDSTGIFGGTVLEEPGPAVATLAMMCIAAIAGSMLAIGASATEDERAHGTFS